MPRDLHELTIVEALESMASGKLGARDLVDALISRCVANSHLNAFVSEDWDALRLAADTVDASGRAGTELAGIPLIFKDNIATGQFPAGAATGALGKLAPPRIAPVAQLLLEKGALVGGTGNMHELAFGITTNNAVTGASRNPWNTEMIAGGSSGGVAAAVAAGLMPGGIGTDTGGSVRLPAALCGVVGFRPTVGRYSGRGIVPISKTRDTAGPIARSVADVRLLDEVMTGGKTGRQALAARELRLGLPRSYFYASLEPAVAACAEDALVALCNAGVQLVEVDVPDVGSLNDAISFPVVLHEFIRDLRAYLDENEIALTLRDVCNDVGSPDVRAVFESLLAGGAMPQQVYREAIDLHRPKLQAAYRDCFAQHGIAALIFPTTPMTTRRLARTRPLN